MGNSLSDQLLKAGLVSKGKAKKSRHEQKGQRKKGGGGASEEAKAAAARAAAEKAERDRELNRQKEEARREREAEAQIRQLIDSNRKPLAEPGQGEDYNFTDGTTIKRIHVPAEMAKQLADGRLAIVRFDEGYAVVAAAVAEKLRERDAERVVLLNDAKGTERPDEDDPYAEYQIPDDLMW